MTESSDLQKQKRTHQIQSRQTKKQMCSVLLWLFYKPGVHQKFDEDENVMWRGKWCLQVFTKEKVSEGSQTRQGGGKCCHEWRNNPGLFSVS